MAESMIRKYLVCYRMTQNAIEDEIIVPASNKIDAYQYATYTAIPAMTGQMAYAVWVQGLLLKDGSIKLFNTCEGNPY